jgi:hypothetical protein
MSVDADRIGRDGHAKTAVEGVEAALLEIMISAENMNWQRELCDGFANQLELLFRSIIRVVARQ